MTLVLERRNFHNQLAASIAAKSLGATVSTVYEPNLSTDYNSFSCIGKMLSRNSDLLVIGTQHQSNLEEIAAHATVPIINLTTDFQRPIDAIATLLTLYEHFRYLKGLNVALIGCPYTVFHSYMCSFSRLGLNTKLSCTRGVNMISPCYLNVATDHCTATNTLLLNCHTPREAVKDADVIIAAPKGDSSVDIALEDTFNCNWTFIQNFGEGIPNLNEYFVHHSRSLTFNVIENITYTYATLMMKMLCKVYQHTSSEPTF